MIVDALANADRYLSVHKGFDAAFAFLRHANLAELAPGRHELAGDWVYVMVIQGDGKGKEVAKLEAHRRYVDIQYVISGVDAMGWKPTADCTQPDSEFNETKDAVLFSDAPTAWVDVNPGEYAIFFPEDAHAPMGGQGELHKIVVKVAV